MAGASDGQPLVSRPRVPTGTVLAPCGCHDHPRAQPAPPHPFRASTKRLSSRFSRATVTLPIPRRSPPPSVIMTSTVCPPAASFFGFMGAASALIFSNLGAAYGTAKSGVGVASMGVMRPELVMRCIIPVVMAGVLGIYGLIVAVIVSGQVVEENYPYFLGFAHLASGLSNGLSGLAAGICIGIVGDAGVRATGQNPKLYVIMILILIFAEALALYGLIVALILSGKTTTAGCYAGGTACSRVACRRDGSELLGIIGEASSALLQAVACVSSYCGWLVSLCRRTACLMVLFLQRVSASVGLMFVCPATTPSVAVLCLACIFFFTIDIVFGRRSAVLRVDSRPCHARHGHPSRAPRRQAKRPH
eukprot:contig_14689_g3534